MAERTLRVLRLVIRQKLQTKLRKIPRISGLLCFLCLDHSSGRALELALETLHKSPEGANRDMIAQKELKWNSET